MSRLSPPGPREGLSISPPLQPGQCWQLKQAIAPFARLAVFLTVGKTTEGIPVWEVAIPCAEWADRLFQQVFSPNPSGEIGTGSAPAGGWLGQESFPEPVAGSAAPSGPSEVPDGSAGATEPLESAVRSRWAAGLLLAVPEPILVPNLEQLVAEGLPPSQVRQLLRLPERVYFLQGPWEEGFREAVAAWQWEFQQLRGPSPENFFQALQQADSETLCQMLQQDPGLLHQMLPAGGSQAQRGLGASLGQKESWADQGQEVAGPALCWAVRFGHPEIVELLVKKGAQVNASDLEGNTPLHWACQVGHREIAERLLEYGADPRRRNHAGQTPLLMAARSPAWEGPCIAQLLLDAGAEADLNSLVALGRVDQVLERLRQGPEALATAVEPDQLLSDALWAIGRAMARRMDPAVLDSETLDQLMAEYLPMLKGLLEVGVDPNAGFPLWQAVQLPDPRPAELLLRWGADPNRKIQENMFPLEVARTEAIGQLLRRYGAKGPEDPELVIQRETQHLAHFPEDPEALRRRAEAWGQLGRYEEALADWARLIELAPERPEGYLGQAWIWATCPQEEFRDGQAALESARRAVELAGGWHNLASQRVWHQQSGQVSVRIEYWLTYAAALAELGQFQEAGQVLEEVLRLAGPADRPRIRYLRSLFGAEQPYRAGSPQEEPPARTFSEESSVERGFWQRLRCWLGRLLRKLRQPAGAKVPP